MSNYTTAGLDRLYQAVQHHAEQEFMSAVKREYPGMSKADEAEMLNHYRQLCFKAEQRIIEESLVSGQSRGK